MIRISTNAFLGHIEVTDSYLMLTGGRDPESEDQVIPQAIFDPHRYILLGQAQSESEQLASILDPKVSRHLLVCLCVDLHIHWVLTL